MKAKIVPLLIISVFICCASNAEQTVVPTETALQPSGTTSAYLTGAQSAKESLISTKQAMYEAAQTNFVTATGTDLTLNGSTYKFSFANNYYLFYKSQTMVDNVFGDAKALGLNSLRTWGFCDGTYKEGVAFQTSPGVYDESGFRNMDYVIYKASQENMKLIISFVNNWNDFGGMDQYVTWLTGSTPTASQHDLFYTDPTIKGWYRNYVDQFLNRVNPYNGVAYKNDPAILIWELANEPRANTDSTGTVLNPWINEMAQYVKSIDPNHLLSAGVEGWYGYKDTWGSNTGVDFVTSQSSPYIDIATFHLFPDDYNLTDTQAIQWVTDRAGIAQTILKKPVYIGEFGKKVDRTATDTATQMRKRDAFLKNIYSTASSAKINGLGLWMIASLQDGGAWYPDYDRYTIYYGKDASTTKIIKSGSSSFLTTVRRGRK